MKKISQKPTFAEGLESVNDFDIKQKIVEELLDREKNLDSKTELDKPILWSTLHSVINYLEDKEMSISASILQKFEKVSFTFLISNKRKGRDEYIQALKALGNLDNIPHVNPLNPIKQ